MKKSIFLITIGVITLFASSQKVCSNVEILTGVLTPKSSAILEKQVFEKSCKVIEIKGNYAVRCGCYKNEAEVYPLFRKLKKKYPQAKITKSYMYRFKNKIVEKKIVPKEVKVVEQIEVPSAQKIPIVPKEMEKKKVSKKIEPVVEIEIDNNEELVASEELNTTDDKTKYEEIIVFSKSSNIVISVGLGYSLSDIAVNKSNQVKYDENIKLNLLSFNLGADYYFNALSFGVDYQYSQNSQIRYNNTMGNLTYNFKTIFGSPYIGILAGFSNICWTDYPVKNIKKLDSSWSLATGLKIGAKIPITKEIDFYSQYRYIFIDSKTLAKNGVYSTSIKIEAQESFLFGLSYKL